MSLFSLKLIALIFMTLDHAYKILPFFGWLDALISDNTAFYLIYYLVVGAGRIAFPIFAFTVANGLAHTSDLRRYLLRITIFALVSEPVFFIVHNSGLNIFFTLAITAAAAVICRKYNFVWQKIIIYIAAGFIAEITGCDYGAFGVAAVLLFVEVKAFPTAAFASSALLALSYLRSVMAGSLSVYAYVFVVIGYIIAAVLLSTYNGKRGRPVKWLFYVYYPAHLTALWGLSRIIN